MPLSRSDTEHLLRRVGFGATETETDHFSGRELSSVLDEMFAKVPPVPSTPSFVHHAHLEWYGAKLATSDWWVDRMAQASWLGSASAPSPLYEKLALFWHSHFACGTAKIVRFNALWRQLRTFYARGLGDFETLTRAIVVDGAMLVFLDNHSNRKGREQENLARELMELHTCGVGNFTERDVISMAKAWTGHGVVDGFGANADLSYRFYPDRHDTTKKALFGLPARNWNGPATITELVKGAKQTATARFISTKLWRYYVNDTPTTADIDGLAQVFIASGMRIGPVLRSIFEHPTFWAPQTRFGMIRQPLEWGADILRRFDVPADRANITWLSRYLGQDLFRPPNVAGWGTNTYWISTTSVWAKARFLKALRNEGSSEAVFAGIQHGSRAAAVDQVLDVFGVTEPTARSVDKIGDWFDWIVADNPAAAPRDAVYIGGLLPEVQAG